MKRKPRKWWLVPVAAMILSIMFLPHGSMATEWYWVLAYDLSGRWNYLNNWASPGDPDWIRGTDVGFPVPAAGDNALLVLPHEMTMPGVWEPWVDVIYVSETNPTLNALIIEGRNMLVQTDQWEIPVEHLHLTTDLEIIGGSGWSFTIPPPPLYFQPEGVGIYPIGKHDQRAGTNTVNEELILGNESGSEGYYILSGGQLTVGSAGSPGTEIIGYQGTGEFTHSGGNHTVYGNLRLGWDWDGSGTYELQDTAALEVNGNEQIGIYGNGEFTQHGGTNSADAVTLAQEVGSTGTYNLYDGTLEIQDHLTVGSRGEATFNQWAGTVRVGEWGSVPGELTLGYVESGEGNYYLHGGLLEVYGTEYIARDGFAYFEQNGGRNHALNVVIGPGNYALNGGMFEATRLEVGEGAGGTLLGGLFIQNGASSIATVSDLTIGEDEPDKGLYTLSAGTLEVGDAIVGGSGRGDFLHTGGVANMTTLTLGAGETGKGSYDLQGDGALTVSGNETIGVASTGDFVAPGGLFVQSGGSHQVENWLVLAQEAGSSGTYDLSGGSLTVGRPGIMVTEIIGGQGEGNFQQTNGIHTLHGDLILGQTPFSNGTYALSGGELAVDGHAKIGDYGSGRFEQSGGLHTVGRDLTLARDLFGNGTYVLSDGDLEVGGDTEIWGTFEQSAGSHTGQELRVRSGVGHSDTRYTLSGGNLDMVRIRIDGETASFNQLGGSNLTGGLFVSLGDYQLSGGNLEVIYDEWVGVDSDFDQSGGTQIVHGDLSTRGVFTYSGGSLTVEGAIWNGFASGEPHWGRERFIITGNPDPLTADIYNRRSFLIEDGTVEINGDVVNRRWDGFGAYCHIQNSTVSFNGDFLNAHNVDYYSILEIENSAVEFNGSVVNEEYSLFGLEGDIIEIRNSLVDFEGSVTNRGILEIYDSTVYGSITNSGELRTDPSSLYLPDLIVTETGYLVSGLDYFYISGDFINHSIMNNDWVTLSAYLAFVTGPETMSEEAYFHDLYLTGADLGDGSDGSDGYYNNFAWGTLSVDPENTIRLYDGNTELGGALYASEILGIEIMDRLVTNILGDENLNIYYLASLAGNNYLRGLSYDLTGGGQLIPFSLFEPGPEPVPEPATMLLLGSGLIFLAAFRRRFRKR